MLHGYVVIQKKSGGDGPLYPVNSSIKIGRGTHCGIRVHVQSVSEEHSLICVERGKKALIRNLSTSSLTLVNGVSIGSGQAALNHDDLITVGGRTFRWMYPDHSQFKRSGLVSKRRKSVEIDRSSSPRVAVHLKRHTLGALTSGPALRSPKHRKSLDADKTKKAQHGDKFESAKLSNKSLLQTPHSSSKSNNGLNVSTKSCTPKLSKESPTFGTSVLTDQTSRTAEQKKIKTPGSTKSSHAVKRKLSSASTSAAKKLKIESPKAIDKKKMAALIGIHRKSPWVSASPSHKSKAISMSASKTGRPSKTPQGRHKTPAGSAQKVSVWGIQGSSSKTRRPLFSEVLKRAKQRVNAGKRAVALPLKGSSKIHATKRSGHTRFAKDIPKAFHFNSTGHANSPDPIYIGCKKTVTPVVTRKGRKEGCFVPLSVKDRGDKLDFSGLSSMFKTPGRNKDVKSSAELTALKSSSPKIEGRSPGKMDPILLSTSSETEQRRSPRVSFQNNVQLLTQNSVPSPRLKRSSEELKSPKSNISGVSGKLVSSPALSFVPHDARNSLKSSAQLITDDAQKQTRTPSKNRSSLRTPSGSISKCKDSVRSPTTQQSLEISEKQKITPFVSKSTPNIVDKRVSVRTPITRSHAALSGRQSSHKKLTLSERSCLTSTPAPSFNMLDAASGKSSSRDSSSARSKRSPVSSQKSPLLTHSTHMTPVKSSFKNSPSKSGSSPRPKSLSVSFDDSVEVQNMESDFGESKSNCETPDMTFDFNSVKTPNVPSEMFVSSIFSSGSSCGGYAAGSAKRKGKSSKSSPGIDLQGVRRLMKTPASPAGYVDVRGIKRLMASPAKSPTYLAVEGVKKLFGDAVSSSNNSLSFVGVKELFASPSPKARAASGKSQVHSPEVVVDSKPSPVAKILAEVEGKTTPTFSCVQISRKVSPEYAASPPKNASLSLKNSGTTVSPMNTSKEVTNLGNVANTDFLTKSNEVRVSSRRQQRKKETGPSPLVDACPGKGRRLRQKIHKVDLPIKITSPAGKSESYTRMRVSPCPSKSPPSAVVTRGKRKATYLVESKTSPVKRARRPGLSQASSTATSSNPSKLEDKKSVEKRAEPVRENNNIPQTRGARGRGTQNSSSVAQTVEASSKRTTKRKKKEIPAELDNDFDSPKPNKRKRPVRHNDKVADEAVLPVESSRSSRSNRKKDVKHVISPVKATRSRQLKNSRNSTSTPPKKRKVAFQDEASCKKQRKQKVSDLATSEKHAKQSIQISDNKSVESPPKTRRGQKQIRKQSPTKATSEKKSKNVREQPKSSEFSPRKTRSARK